jgi:hypothetical protein
VDDKPFERGKDFHAGYEKTSTGTDLILWLKMKSTEETSFIISPPSK